MNGLNCTLDNGWRKNRRILCRHLGVYLRGCGLHSLPAVRLHEMT